MNLKLKVLLLVSLSLVVSGCSSTRPARTELQLTPESRLAPTLGAETVLQIYVVDERPAIEIEKQPTTDYLYSGSLFTVDRNAQTIAQEIGNIVVKFEGAKVFSVVDTMPVSGIAIVFKLKHWYSRMPRNPDQAPIEVTGTFGGALSMFRGGKVIFSKNLDTPEVTAFVDMFIMSNKEKLEKQKLLWISMLQTANKAQQHGYTVLHATFRENWHKFSM